MAYLAGSLFGPGSDTTAVAIMYVAMASACYPNAQEKVQEHLDIVVGRDRERQVYSRGCNRLWQPLVANHMYSKRVCRSPFDRATSSLVRPDHLPNPDQFDPQRWLNSDGKIRDDLKSPSYDFNNLQNLPRITQDPENLIDEMGFVDDVIVHPKPFVVRFQLRFGDEALLRDVMAKYEEDCRILSMIKTMNILLRLSSGLMNSRYIYWRALPVSRTAGWILLHSIESSLSRRHREEQEILAYKVKADGLQNPLSSVN
ncbi:hypothetical protein EDB19DRAFT_1923234 [Suillus lakei]|nr:hypothetical protein EDB19DRAFT_1923234 [Suillus lakei]